MKRLGLLRISISVWASALCAINIWAEEDGIKLGGMQFHPFVSGEITQDSNVFQTPDAESDVYAEASVGARLKRDTDSIHFDSSAWYSRREYCEYTAKDANRWGLAGVLRSESDKTFGVLLFDGRQVDDYDLAPVFGSVPSGFAGTVDAAFDRTSSSDPRRIFNALAGGGYKLGDKVSVMGGYKFYAVNYYEPGSSLEGWIENALGVEVSSEMTDKAVVFMNGQFGAQSGDGAPYGKEADLLTLRLGIKNNLTDKSTLRLALGATHYVTDKENYFEPSFELSGLWNSTERLTVFVFGRNEVQPVGDGVDVQMTARASTGVNFVLNRAISMVLSGSLVNDRYLDDTLLPDGSYGKPVGTTLIGTYRINVTPVKRLDLFGQIEATDAKQDLAGDYTRLRLSAGLGYAF
ncbi:hypothetical protein P4E94_18030 [Pontiellaceae bacterium B12219]|nr:hypothetical protein [Pontiellaceae bacterium B12219]